MSHPNTPPGGAGRQPLTLGRELLGGTVVVTAHGEVDIATSDDLREVLLDAIKESGAAAVVLDLNGMTFFASVGVRVLFAARREAAGLGKRLVLVARAGSLVHRVLEIVGLVPSDDWYETVDEALDRV